MKFMRVHIIKLSVIIEKKCDAKQLFSNETYKRKITYNMAFLKVVSD